jgi:protein transport protein SEC24
MGLGLGGLGITPQQQPHTVGTAPSYGSQNNQQQPTSPRMYNDSVDYSIQIPKEMFRMTSTTIPASANMVTTCKVPTGGLLRPFTNLDEGEIDLIRPGAGGIIRCNRCRTYINPFVQWLENGRKWRCNICSNMNETSSAYYCHLDANNQRKDKDIRPELSKGVVEWAAPTEYQVRPPQPPTFFFVLDVSAGAIHSGMLASTADAIKRSLDDLPGGDRTMVGFITFDASVHYYALAPNSSNAQMMVVGDLEELFVPAPTDLLVYLRDSRDAVDNLLDNLPTMFANNTATASCLGPALKAAYTVMKAVGGKMSVFQSVMPNLGDGALKARENPRMMGTPDEVKLLRPGSNFFRDTAIEFSKQHISVDMYVFPHQYIDIASLAEMPRITAGAMHSYVAFDYERDGPTFESQLYRRLTQPIAFEAVLRIRCTKGMQITNFYGNFHIRGQDLLSLPNCSADAVFGFDLNHDEQSINEPFVTIQSALLYTTSDGERRIRVTSQALKTTTRISEFMESVDAEAVAALLSKQALNVAIKTNLDNARNKLQHTCAEMIRASKEGDKRTVSGYTVPSSQPEADGDDNKINENLELLPLYTLALMKNVAFRGGTDVNSDERIAAHMKLLSMYVEDTIGFIHPKLFSIHNMDSQAGLPVNDDDVGNDNIKTAGRDMILLPQAINLSVESLSSEGLYLLDNGCDSFLWVGRASDAATNNALFGLDSLDGVNVSQVRKSS